MVFGRVKVKALFSNVGQNYCSALMGGGGGGYSYICVLPTLDRT